MIALRNTLLAIRENIVRQIIVQEELFTYVNIIINGDRKEYISADLMIIEFKKIGSDLTERALVTQCSYYVNSDGVVITDKSIDDGTVTEESFYMTDRYRLITIYKNVISEKELLSSDIDIQSTTEFRKRFNVCEGCCHNEDEIDEELKVLQIK